VDYLTLKLKALRFEPLGSIYQFHGNGSGGGHNAGDDDDDDDDDDDVLNRPSCDLRAWLNCNRQEGFLDYNSSYLKHNGVNLFLDFIISENNTILCALHHHIQESQPFFLT
jgi:hypothetical protein